MDPQDYLMAGIIGPNQTEMTVEDWQLMRDVAFETRNAYDLAIDNYILTSNIADSPCSDKRDSLLQERLDNRDAYHAIFDSFWQALIDDNATKEQYDAYTSAFKKYIKSVKNLIAVIDGDRFKIIN